jgi:hypothetical protein
MRISLLAAILLLHSATTPAAQPAPTGCPATLREYHQFDFWIGDWEVRNPQGAIAGHSHIEAISDGCGISEHWSGASGSTGVSYNAWDPETKRWYQFWIGNAPDGVLSLEGGIVRSEMVLQGSRLNAKTSKPQKQRIIWTPNADGSVRQHWETSDDGGKTWANAFDGTYRRTSP